MRYIEFVYLGLAGMSFTFLVMEFERLSGRQLTFLLLALGIFAFMFAFRRRQRLLFEAKEQEEMEELKSELSDWAEEQDEAHRKRQSKAESQVEES